MSCEYGFFFIKENCIQCHACEVACKSWRGIESGITWRRVVNIWQGHYPDVKNISASIACMHCVDPACIAACPEEAIFKRVEDGIVLVDSDKCVGCQACLHACPINSPAFDGDGKMQKCDMCYGNIDYGTDTPPCVATCPTRALIFGKMDVRKKSAMEQSLKQYE